jgi:hypothetical protein
MARCKAKEKNQLKQLSNKGEWKAKNEINKGELTSTIRTSHQELHQQNSRDGEFLGEKSVNATGGTHLMAPSLFFPLLLTTRRPPWLLLLEVITSLHRGSCCLTTNLRLSFCICVNHQ